MRVCLLTPVYPFPEPGVYVGIERIASELSLALQKSDIDVEVITTFWNGGASEDVHRGVPIHRVWDTSHALGSVGRLLDAHYLSFSFGLQTRAEVFDRCDLTHSLMPIANPNWIRKRTPLVTNFQHEETADDLLDWLYLPVHHWMERRTYQQADRVIVSSSASDRDVQKAFDIDGESITIIPHGVDTDEFSPVMSADDSETTFSILFVGPLEQRKNVPTIVRAVAKAKPRIDSDLVLHIAGDGPARERIGSVVKEYGIENETVFHGYCDDDDLIPLYQSADVFVFPSFKEGFGMVMVEAMACRTPVIAPNESPFDEVVGDTGILADRDSGSIADALVALASDRSRMERLKDRAYQRVTERFTWEAVVDEYVDLYEQVV